MEKLAGIIIIGGAVILFAGSIYEFIDRIRFKRELLNLPKAGEKCRSCGQKQLREISEHNGKFVRDQDGDFVYDIYPALKAEPCPESCQIQIQHLHVECQYCRAAYATRI